MSPVIVFGLLLIACFGVLFYFLRPTRSEKAVERHLAGIHENPTQGIDPTNTILKPEDRSSTPWLDDVIRGVPGSSGLSGLIKQSGRKWHLGSLLISSVLALIVVGWLASLIFSSSAVGFLIGLAAALSPCVYLYVLREIRFRGFDTLLPEAVDLMARGLRAGHAVSAVLEMVGNEVADPVGSEFRALYEEQSLGLPAREAMLNLVQRVPRDDMRFLAAAIMMQKETGGNLALILDKTAAVMRERSRLRGQLNIYTAQGRITGWILCIAPFGMFALISVVNHDYERVLFTDPLGRDLVYAGLIMILLGILVIRKIIDIKV